MPAKYSLEIPAGVSAERAAELLNDRLRTIQNALEAPLKLDADLDAGGKRIVNLGEPQAGNDALNRNAADKRYLQSAQGGSGGGPGATTTTVIQQSGGNLLLLSVAGILSIRSSAAPLAMLGTSRTASSVKAILKQAPLGADLDVRVLVGGAAWARVLVAAGNTRGEASGSLSQIAAGAEITVDLIAVGTTFPGADLTIAVALA